MTRAAPVLRARALRIPFRTAFSHGSATRTETQALWCEVEGGGHVGVGEGCPREYVTAESIESATAFVEAHRERACRAVHDIDSLWRWTAGNAAAIDANPAAWCAMELAFLDWLSRAAGVTVEAALGEPPVDGEFRYTAVLGDMSAHAYAQLASLYRAEGFTDFKVKLSGRPAADRAKLEALLALDIDGLRVRVDANNLWPDAATAVPALRMLAGVCPLAGVEEPTASRDIDTLGGIAEDIGSPVILDESCRTLAHVERAARRPEAFIVNLRVSKMGGLVRALACARRAVEAALPVVVGAQVGETSVLTRAALPVARAAGSALFAQEGAFGTRLLERDVVDRPLAFGPGGLLDASARGLSHTPGWGI